jgi:hypothetical protein
MKMMMKNLMRMMMMKKMEVKVLMKMMMMKKMVFNKINF